jgi:hypothetical protein
LTADAEQPPEEFVPLNAVEQRLMAAATGDEAAQKAFERSLADATLYVATPQAMPTGEQEIAANTTVQLLSIPLGDGRNATAIFTAIERITPAFGEEVGYMALPGKTLFGIISADPAVLNPGQTFGVVWEPANLAAMARLPTERTVAKDTQVMLGSPAEHPTELIVRLKQAFAPLPQVKAAWLALAFWPEEKTQGWYLDVRSTADPDPIRRALAAALENADLDDRPLDMVINPPGGKDGAGLIVIAPAVTTAAKTKPKGLLSRLFKGRA